MFEILKGFISVGSAKDDNGMGALVILIPFVLYFLAQAVHVLYHEVHLQLRWYIAKYRKWKKLRNPYVRSCMDLFHKRSYCPSVSIGEFYVSFIGEDGGFEQIKQFKKISDETCLLDGKEVDSEELLLELRRKDTRLVVVSAASERK